MRFGALNTGGKYFSLRFGLAALHNLVFDIAEYAQSEISVAMNFRSPAGSAHPASYW